MTAVLVCLALITCLILYLVLRTYRLWSLKSVIQFAKDLGILGGILAAIVLAIITMMFFGFIGPFLVALGALIFWAELTVPNAR
jgi:hypothetical protein